MIQNLLYLPELLDFFFFLVGDNIHRSPTQYMQWTGRFCQVSLLDKLQLKSLYAPFLGGSETQEALNAFRCISHKE